MKYTSKNILDQYNKFYNENVKSFSYRGETELEEIILEIFELDEDDYYVEVGDNYSAEIFER